MGFRVTRKLHEAGYDLRAVEIGEAGKARLAEAGIAAVMRRRVWRAPRWSCSRSPTT